MSNIYCDESIILLDVEAETRDEVLTTMGNNLVNKSLVQPSFVPAIIERENEFPTGLPTAGVSVAIPHTDVEHVIQKNISVAILKSEVGFGVMGDDSEQVPVKIVFMLAMDEAHSQLSLLQKLMQIFQDENELLNMVKQTEPKAIKEILEEKLNFQEFKGGHK
ncbi:PTS sugar transporter subunit IIA [Halobacillus sp. K22]|uniref:PTS sugar transporter subunit IIA n=1 Tax=Halobacillus sp. K22 TaxID=3457431 RepID=UPI003FCDE491